MGKKKNGQKPEKLQGRRVPPARRRQGGGGWILPALGALLLGFGVLAFWKPLSSSFSGKSGVRHYVPGGERRPTLNPALFSGAVAQAYQVAREIPEVLDKLYCYCFCIENSGHLSNLSCYVDSHAAG